MKVDERFLIYPDKRLRTPAEPVEKIDYEIHGHWVDMIDIMEKMPGLGLAAPQIGLMLRLAVVDASEERGQAVRLANPEVIDASEETMAVDEASPNLMGVAAKINRPERVTVRFLNQHGVIEERDFEGVWSISVQHQIDHLNGKMYIDHLGRTKREMLIRKAQKQAHLWGR